MHKSQVSAFMIICCDIGVDVSTRACYVSLEIVGLFFCIEIEGSKNSSAVLVCCVCQVDTLTRGLSILGAARVLLKGP